MRFPFSAADLIVAGKAAWGFGKDARRRKRSQRRALNWQVGLPGLCSKLHRKDYILAHGIEPLNELVGVMYKEDDNGPY